MNATALTLLSDAHFLLAQVLWDPRADRDRALRIASLAAKTHPDPSKRATIVGWLEERNTRDLEDLAIEDLQHCLRTSVRAAEARDQSSPYLEISVTEPIEPPEADVTRPCEYIDISVMWPADVHGIEARTQPFARV